MDSIYNYTCTSCGLDISVSSIENLPTACPRCKCIDWLSEGKKNRDRVDAQMGTAQI